MILVTISVEYPGRQLFLPSSIFGVAAKFILLT